MTAAAQARPFTRGRSRSAAIGTLALSGSNIVRLGVQLAMLPLLARLIGPADYGLIALAVPFVLFCNMLADGGLGAALARRSEVSADLESTVFWLAAAIGGGLAALSCLAAWPLAMLMGEPALPSLIIALSPILIMSGFTAAANARVIREARFGVFASGDLISVGVSSTTALLAATHGWGAWSLVAQQLTLWACKLVWVLGLSRLPIRTVCQPRLAIDLLRFGRDTIGANLADFAARNAGAVIVGGVLGTLTLGYYAMAYQIVRIPDLVISGPLSLYIFTAVARAAERDPNGANGAVSLASLGLTATALAPVFCGLALVADLAVAVVLGPKWTPAGPILTCMSAAGFAFSICSVVAATFLGLGRSALQLRLALVGGATAIAAVAVAAPLGPLAASLAVAASTSLVALIYLTVLIRTLGVPALAVAARFGPAALSAAAMSLALIVARRSLADVTPLAQLAALVALGAMVYGGTALLTARRALRRDLEVFLQAHGD
jgi:O-antigen/teichoic acid export membrane protein